MKRKTPKTPKFDTLTPEQKRVAIAKDVLAQIKVGKLQLQNGTYYKLGRGWDDVTLTNRAKLLKQNPKCEACALGAAVVSAIRVFNQFNIQKSNGNDSFLILTVLKNWFSERQIGMIETAFEPPMGRIICNARGRAGKFYKRHELDTAEDRAIAIFTNIIKNGGTFKP